MTFLRKLLFTAVILLFFAPDFLPGQEFTLVGTLPVDAATAAAYPVGVSQIRAVSEDGMVAAGFSQAVETASNNPGLGQPVVWTRLGGLRALPNLGGPAVNLRGSQTVSDMTPDGIRLIGRALYNPDFPTLSEAAIWTRPSGGTWSVLGLGGLPGAVVDTRPNVVSADGSILYGFGRTAANQFVAFRWTAGSGVQPLPLPTGYNLAVPAGRGTSIDGALMVGFVQNTSSDPAVGRPHRPYLWEGLSQHGFLPVEEGMDAVLAEGISADGGTVYGRYYTGSDIFGGEGGLLRWTLDGEDAWQIENLGRPVIGLVSNFMGVSADGAEVVFSITDSTGTNGWLHNSHGFTPLRAVLESVSPATASYQVAVLGMTANARHVFGHARQPGGRAIGYILSLPPGYLAETRVLEVSEGETLNLSTEGPAALVLEGENTVEDLTISGPTIGEGSTTLAVNPDADLTVNGSATIDSGGSMNVLEGGNVSVGESVTVADEGSLQINGTLTSPETVIAGQLSGSGELNSDLTVEEGGTVSPGTSPGRLQVSGATAFGAGSRLVMEVGGTEPATEHDQLVVTGPLTIAGALEVIWEDDYTPADGDTLRLINHAAGERTGIFSPVDGLEALAGFEVELIYRNDGVELKLTALPTSFELWAEANALPAEFRGPEDIPLRDGLPNLLRFALGIPYAAGAGRERLPQFDLLGGRLLGNFQVRGDVNLVVEASGDLKTWHPLVPPELVLTPAGDGQVEAAVDFEPTDARRFIRLRIGP